MLVTGAAGVVGSALVARLARAGVPVRAIVRHEAAARRVADLGATVVWGDLRAAGPWQDALAGCRWVFHVAGHNAYCLRDPAPLFEDNVVASLRVLRAADAAGVERFVHTSSAVAIGEAKGEAGQGASRHRGYFLTAYERSKFEAETAILAEPVGVARILVNSASVQGPGRAGGTAAVLLRMASGRLPLAIDTRLSIVDIRDCAAAHQLAAERGKPGRRHVLSGFTMGLRELAMRLRALAGAAAPRPPILIPDRLAGLLARALPQLWGGRAGLCPETLANLRHGAVYDGRPAALALGLSYRPAEETLTDLVAWFAGQGLLGDRASVGG